VNASRLRAIPSVDKVVLSLGHTDLPRALVLDVVRRELKTLRTEKSIPRIDAIVERIRQRVRQVSASRIQPLINGTGVIVHTNFGRAPLGPDVVRALSSIGTSYNNLEYDLATGGRGDRAAYLERGLASICGAEAATIVNNNAAALMLIVRHFCRPDASDVVISRGELVQIGGGFRIPDVLESSGARLREVGTTNQTSTADYARAITKETALVLRVHRSNFFIEGFVHSPTTEDIAALAHRKRVPFVEDLGSGAIVQTQSVEGLEHEPTPSEVIRRGVDLVCFSGDKLFAGPQAGVIAGAMKFVTAIKREPLFRAVRCDKLILAALETMVDAYLRDQPSAPVLDMLHLSIDELRVRAERIVNALDGLPIQARVGTGRSQIGGGTLPRSSMASVTIELAHHLIKSQDLAARLRQQPLPVIGYMARGILKLDLRTIFPRQDDDLIQALRIAASV